MTISENMKSLEKMKITKNEKFKIIESYQNMKRLEKLNITNEECRKIEN